MFRITRGMHVQHIQFPLPILGPRDLDAEEGEAPTNAAARIPEAAPAEDKAAAEDIAG
jgi:hypothetical protein